MAARVVYGLALLAAGTGVSADFALRPEFAWNAEDDLIGYQGSGSGIQPPFQVQEYLRSGACSFYVTVLEYFYSW